MQGLALGLEGVGLVWEAWLFQNKAFRLKTVVVWLREGVIEWNKKSGGKGESNSRKREGTTKAKEMKRSGMEKKWE